MRTPAQTLERLAEVAPKEWRMSYAGGLVEWYRNEHIVIRDIARHDFDDIDNGAFPAWCKKQLSEKGYCLSIEITSSKCPDGMPEGVAIQLLPADGEIIEVPTHPTEWQAVAECLIAVLEKENE